MRNLTDAAVRPPPAPPGAVIAWDATTIQAPSPRCVSLPFTAPTLTAMRVRVPQNGGLEMLLSNPAGGRGIYVAGWAMLRSFAAPSLHDILLADRVAAQSASRNGLKGTGMEPLSPASVRVAAVAVAAEGHAGRRVALAAQRAQQAEQLGRRRLRAHLLLELARALDLQGSHSALNDPWTSNPDNGSGWLAEAPHLLARLLDGTGGRQAGAQAGTSPWLPAELDAAVSRIAALAWPLGIGPAAAQARLPRVLRLLSDMKRPEPAQPAVVQAGATQAGAAQAGAARTERHDTNLDGVVTARIAQAEASLHQARALFDDPVALLSGWRTHNAAMLHTLEQPDWLLDGWDRLCLLPGDAVETGALAQMLLYRETAGEEDWRIGGRGTDPEWAVPQGITGAAAAIERLARNEAMRLRELQLHDPDLDVPPSPAARSPKLASTSLASFHA